MLSLICKMIKILSISEALKERIINFAIFNFSYDKYIFLIHLA